MYFNHKLSRTLALFLFPNMYKKESLSPKSDYPPSTLAIKAFTSNEFPKAILVEHKAGVEGIAQWQLENQHYGS